jgi:2-polyprenyl-3-methyl-5-hydroxy-6-metoxy-1,4-benzoquinol methylase
MRTILCPLCSATASVPVWRQDYGPLTVTTVLCPSCGLVFHNPVVEDEDRQKLGLTHRQLHTNEPISPRQLRRVQRRVARQIAFLQDLIQSGWRTLEIGCGLGLLSQWLSRQGCAAVGVEPDRQQAEFARQQFGFEVIHRRFELTDFHREFDFFAASHVIEHFPDPLGFLKKIRSLAGPGARLFLETPNILAPKVGPRRVFSLAHNFYFSPQTLSASLAATGWQVERTRVFRRDSFLMLARAAEPFSISPGPAHARLVLQAIRRHRLAYYLSLSFLLRKIPGWRHWWLYRYTDYTGALPQEQAKAD